MNIINLFFFIGVLLTGLCVGSFLNVVIYRLPRRVSIVFGRSRCPACGRVLVWYELIPVFSFLILRGKCRTCQIKIPPRYLLVESLTVLLFTLLFFKFASDCYLLLKYFFLASFLIAVTFIDLEFYLIPDRLIFFGLAGGIITSVLSRDLNLLQVMLGAIASGGFLLLTAILSKGGMGGGDIKLAGVTGLFLGWPLGPLGIFLAACLGGILSIFLLLLKIKGRKDHIPFGPFIALGSLIALLWGQDLIYFYLSLM